MENNYNFEVKSGVASDFKVAMIKEASLTDLENSRFELVFFKANKIFARNYNVKLIESKKNIKSIFYVIYITFFWF